MKAEAEAEEFRIQSEARGKSDAMKLEGIAQAEKTKQLGLAEAESMLKKAQAWDKYNQAAILEMYLKMLPELAKSIAEPLSKVDKIVVVGGDKNLGTTKITAQVGEILAQMPEVVKTLTGVDMKKYLKNKLASDDDEKKED
jgi:flotillin